MSPIVNHNLGRLQLRSMDPRELFDLPRTDRCHHVATVNAEIFVLAHEDPEYRAVLGDAVNTIDGRVVQWLVALLDGGGPRPSKLSGSDLIYDLAEHCRDAGRRLFLLGASDRSNAGACERLRQLYPGLETRGYAPPVTDDTGDPAWTLAILERLQAYRPHHLVVCFGPPKQELWIARNLAELSRLGVHSAFSLGGSIDFVAGTTIRAPRLVQQMGLEWLFRFACAPRARFWRTVTMFRLPYHALRNRTRDASS